MAKTKKVNLEVPNLLTAHSQAVDRVFKNAVKNALLDHKRANNPVAIWRNGKVVLLAPDEILPNKK